METVNFDPSLIEADTDLLTDSRSLADPERTLFFAFETPMADGHRYIPALYGRGVRRVAVSRVPQGEYPGATFYLCDPREALQALGQRKRDSFAGPLIAVTGSRGKTQVKEMLNAMLREDHNIARSPRSYNSQIGVPLSLWGLTPGTELGIFEAGISRPGEMKRLRAMLRPDIAVVTNVLSDHSEGFSSKAEKLAEKMRLAEGAGAVVFPWDDPDIRRAAEALPGRPRLFGWSMTDPAAPVYREPSFFPLADPREKENAASALAAMLALGLDPADADRRARSARSVGTRLEVSEGVNHCLVVNDDYTCDYHSLRPALEFMARRRAAGQRTTVVLSDISHETLSPADTYVGIARMLRHFGVDHLIGAGSEISAFAAAFEGTDARFFPSAEVMEEALTPSDFNDEFVLLKGRGGQGFPTLLHKLEARTHETVLEVNLDALVDNFNFYRSKLKPTTGLVAMVKASGYGAGAYEVARTLQTHGAAYFAVAVLDEGVDLRKAGITVPIMVLNPKVLNYPLLFANRLEPEIFSFEILDEIIAEAAKLGVTDYPVHIKLDTGMHRLGFFEEELPELIERLRGQNRVRVASVFSHLATADCLDMDPHTEAQLRLYDRCAKRIVDAFPEQKVLRHVLNTAGIVRYPEYQYDMCRLGLGLYGIPVVGNGLEDGLRPVSALKTVIISLREYPAGTAIGYGRRTILDRDTTIATIPVGYADGVNRHLGRGNCSFLVNGVPCPTAGNICMDLCMLDVGPLLRAGGSVKVGDKVEIFGPENPAAYLAEKLDTIPYEILTSVSPRVRRVYFRES